jgi:hypothetical protein
MQVAFLAENHIKGPFLEMESLPRVGETLLISAAIGELPLDEKAYAVGTFVVTALQYLLTSTLVQGHLHWTVSVYVQVSPIGNTDPQILP